MNIKKINQITFNKLFNYNSDRFKIKFEGIKEQNSINGKLSFYILSTIDSSVIETKELKFNNKFINNKLNNLFSFMKKRITNEKQYIKMKKYIENNLYH